MADDKITKAHIIENGKSDYAVDITVSGFSLEGDEPVLLGGAGIAPDPYDLLTAALGECTAMTVRWYARQKNWPLDKVEVNITHQKSSIDGNVRKTDVFTKEIIIHGEALTEEQRGKLVEIAAKCPVQRTLEGTPVIKTETRINV
jgi:putative redox protein